MMPAAPERGHSKAPFTASFPSDPALDALVLAFTHGDYATVRDAGTRLAETTDDASVRTAARELIARTSVDPLARALVVLAGSLLVFLTAWWLSSAHPLESHAGAALIPVDHTTQ